MRFHIRDDVYLGDGKVDTAALVPVGRLAAEYTLTNNVFTTPLEQSLIDAHALRRMERLDGLPTTYSAVGDKKFSASGSVIAD